MLNYIKSEVYRNANTKGNYIFIIGCSLFVILLNVALGVFGSQNPGFPYANTKFSLSSFYTSINILMIICWPLTSLVYGQEFKHQTLKNSISYGISKSKIYFVKFLMEGTIAIISLIIISTAYIISANVMLENSGAQYLNELIRALIGSAPLLLFSLAVAHCLYFTCENENTAGVIWSIIVIVIPTILGMAGRRIEVLGNIAKWMPWNMLGNSFDESTKSIIMTWSTNEGMVNCYIVGIIGVAIFYIVGLILFKKREIK